MKPFVKWAGGKTQLLNEINNRLPQDYNRYYEPFLGGGAVYFHIPHAEAVINDLNKQLINCYIQIRDNAERLIGRLNTIQREFNRLNTDEEKAAYFYRIRERFNNNMFRENLTYLEAANLIFLNKACFNGLYRTNRAGLYNAPFGKRKQLVLCDEDNIREIAADLQDTIILNTDFEEVCATAAAGDFVFFDSPYYDTFDTYQGGGFSEEDHRRLAALYQHLTDIGVSCMLTNSNTEFIKNLYNGFNIDIIEVKRMINADGANRKGEEVIITNY